MVYINLFLACSKESDSYRITRLDLLLGGDPFPGAPVLVPLVSVCFGSMYHRALSLL